ncbi:TfoX/Sxy family protein [Microvirga roseola]|uniref:TfoX/Sxy family protein n=1 Tax=Microvirga roseola TaxID=2883126 RepID=UPI001E375191|nr:TfoX/Sxy family protein [Microvirga roseola]
MSDLPVSSLPGLGPVTQVWLEEAGIRTVTDLRAIGSTEAYRRLKFMFPRRVSVNAIYGLEAALRGCHWLDLPQDVKTALQHQAKDINEALRRGHRPGALFKKSNDRRKRHDDSRHPDDSADDAGGD